MKRYTIYMQPLAAAGELSCFFVTLTMMDAPGLPAVEPVVDSGRVGLWLVENLVAHGFGGKVATWVEHTPPNVVFSTSGSWCARGSWGAWCSGAHRHRQLARLSLHFDIQGLRRRLPKHAKAAFRLRSGDNIIPKLFKQNHFCSLSLSLLFFSLGVYLRRINGVKGQQVIEFYGFQLPTPSLSPLSSLLSPLSLSVNIYLKLKLSFILSLLLLLLLLLVSLSLSLSLSGCLFEKNQWSQRTTGTICMFVMQKMDADNENIEPVTDLGLFLGYLNQCIRRKLNGDSGAGANAGSRIHRAFVAPEPLSELVWDTDKGPSNVTLSPPQSNIGRSTTDRLTDDVDFLTAQTTVHLTREVASKEMTMSPTSDAGVMLICRSSHETGNGSNVEEVKVAVEVSVPHNQEGNCSQTNVEVHEIPQISETKENFITRLSGNGDREGADILFVESDQKIPFVEQTEPLLEDSIGQDRHADVWDQKMQLVLTSKVHPVNESKASDAPVMNKKVQGSRPLDILEATAENDLMNLKDEHAYAAASQFLGSESSPGVKDRFEQGQEMLPGNESVLDKHSPSNSSIHMHRRKGKEKALSDGDHNGRMTKDKDDSHESVESCNSVGLFSSGKKRWNSEEEFIVGSKRFRKQILETPICASSSRQDSSFMVWISSMVKGFSKSIQDEAPPLALTLAHPDHGDENPDNKLITCNLNQGDAVKSIGFQTIFQSLYCPTAERQEAQRLSNNHKLVDISTELELATSPKVCHGENINLGRGFMLPVEKFNKSSSGHEVRSAGSQGKGHTGSEEKKNPCNFPFYKRKDRVSPNSSLCKLKQRRVENVESSSQFKGKTTDEFGYRRDLMGSLWITRFTPKTPSPSLITDHYNKGADGVLECSNDHKHVGDKEQSAGDLVIVIGNNLQNCAADNEGSSAFNRNKGQNGQASMSEFSPILPSSEVRSSEVASVFARRLDALKNITPSSASDYCCSQSETKLNSRIDGDMKLLTGKESQFDASVAHKCFNEDTSRMETGINMSWNANEMRASKKISYRSNSVMQNSASSSVENKLKENQIMPSSQFVNMQIPNIPKGIIESVKRLRLSRTDVQKWMDSRMSLSQLEGFFLRLRLGKWEEGLGGTGYYVSCITGSQKESCPQNMKDSIAVIVGGIRCMVKSKHVSNNDFHEDELRAWWSAASKSSGKIPCEEDLREKVKRKRMLGL